MLLLCATLVDAQQREAGDRPRVERIRVEGADAVSRAELRGAIVTEASRCRSVLLRPICWVTDWRIVVERHFLDPEELPRDELRMRVFYGRRGYRETTVTSELRPHGRGVEVVFRVAEGEPTRIEAIEVTQTEQVLSDRRIRRAGLPRDGDPLNLVQLDTALAHLAMRLGQRGHLDGVIVDTVEIDAVERRARVEVRIEPGPRTTVGELEILGNEAVEERTITNALRLREGGVLRTGDITGSQRSLYESNLFHEARVTVPEQPDSAKRVRIEVREAPPRTARVGGGFNTIEFFQTEARFTHYNWWGGGRRFDVRATVGNLLAPQFNDRGIFRDVLPPDLNGGERSPFLSPTWLASADLMQPAFRAAANTVGLSAFAHRRTVPGIAIDRGFGAELSLTRRFDFGVPATLSYRFEQTAVEAGDLYFCISFGICDVPTVGVLQQQHSLSPAGLGFFADRADNPLAPTSGYRLRLDVEHASALTASDFHYHRIAGEATQYIPFGIHQRRVLAGRLRLGWVRPLASTAADLGIEAGDQALLHPRKRFYSGGSRSVRGFGENQLGPRILTIDPSALRGQRVVGSDTTYLFCQPATPIAACDPNQTSAADGDLEGIPVDAFTPRPLGGTNVLEGSVEYRFPLWGPLQGAVFVDGAIVGERLDALFSEGRGSVTPGFGARFRTPVGPIRIDLGVRPRITEVLPVVTEDFDPDGERQLVRLQNRRDYDPLADTGGFFRQVLARLTLHLAIGEAF